MRRCVCGYRHRPGTSSCELWPKTATRPTPVLVTELTTLAPADSVEDAVRVMRDKALRRLPICDGDQPVGVVSLGDLAIERDPDSALADISTAPPNS